MSNPLKTLRAGCGALGLAALLTLAGCGGPPRAEVSGTVTLDGVPLETGDISFYPAGGAGQSAGGAITGGKYKLTASVGEMTVEVRATKVIGKQKMYDTPDSPVVDKVADVIPPRYNRTSELKASLKSGVNEGVNFELKSK